MELDVNFMRSILTLYDELISNGVSVVYIGKFTHQITKMFTAMYEQEMEMHPGTRTAKKRVYHSMVEILQNMQKHSNELVGDYSLGNGIFMIGKRDEIYYIITANTVSKHEMVSITHAIEMVNSSTQEELKRMYKKQLKEGKISKKGGAGLGLIDIARKAGSKLEYLFLPINNNQEYFVLKVEIDTHKLLST